MKCIRCNHDCKYKERTGRKCPACKGAFAFEPREGDILTDVAFKNAILAVSSHGAVRWGVENLYYEVCRRKKSIVVPIAVIVVLVILCFVSVILAAVKQPAWLIGTLVTFVGFVAALIHRMKPRQFVNVEPSDFRTLWDRWCKVHGSPEGVIERQPQPTKPPALEADIGDYSFDRAVICDRARTVDLLVANNFHFENNCAVLSIEGYPQGPFETVKAMLMRNPKLEVFALHDANVKGCTLVHKLRTDKKWFAEGGVKITDVGLRPGHAKPFVGLFQQSKDAYFPEGEGLTAEEAEWLGQYTLELAVIKPEQVLKRLYRAVNKNTPTTTESADADGGGFIFFSSGGGDGGGGSVYVDRNSFSSDAGDTDGGSDSFG